MNVFEPFRTYSSPRRSAVVFMRATSEPASGSERPNEQRIGSSISGGSHVRLLLLGAGDEHRAGPERVAPSEVPMPEQPQFSSSPTSMPSNDARPRPPYSAGTWRFIRPTACALAITSAGWVMCDVVLGRLRPDLLLGELAREGAQLLCSSVSANETPPDGLLHGCHAGLLGLD